MSQVEEIISELHDLLEFNFKDATNDPLRNARYSSQYRCPKDDCDTNIKGRGPYGKPKLSVTWSKGVFHCWVCGFTGGISALGKYLKEHSRKEFYKLYEQLHGNTKGDNPRFEANNQSVHKLFSDEAFQPLALFDLSGIDNKRKRALRYLHNRGLSIHHVFFYNLLYSATGQYENCIIVPSYDATGRLNYFTGRKAIERKISIPYKNPPISSREFVFNENLIDWNKELIIVEGPFDYLKLHGYNRTALLGSQLKEDDMLFQKVLQHKTPVRLLLDTDATRKSNSLAKLFMSWGISVTVATEALEQLNIKDPGQLDLEDAHHKQVIEAATNTSKKISSVDILRQRLFT